MFFSFFLQARPQMEQSTRQPIDVRTKSCTFRVILGNPSQWYEPTMAGFPLPFATNTATPTGASIVCRPEPQECCKQSKNYFILWILVRLGWVRLIGAYCGIYDSSVKNTLHYTSVLLVSFALLPTLMIICQFLLLFSTSG